MSTHQPGLPHGEEHEEKENHERWLLTYADMITLLVAFFIMMYSMSVLNLAKFKQFAMSIRSGFTGEMEGKKGENMISQNSNVSVDPFIINPSANEKLGKEKKSDIGGRSENDAIFSKLKEQILNLNINKKFQGLIDITQREGNIYIVILTDKIFFKPGMADLTKEAEQLLTEIGKIIRPLNNEISVEGYTSTTPPANNIYRNNWDLSAARAVSVINFFQDNGFVRPERLSLTGYGQWRPVFGVSEANEKNDRVIIAILRKTLKEVKNHGR